MEYSFDYINFYKGITGSAPSAYSFEEKNTERQFSRYGGSPYYGIDALGREYYLPVELGGMQLSYPVVRVSTRNRIVSTPLVEQPGSVKEFISAEDYQIDIKGILLSRKNELPEDDMIALKELWDRKEALVIRNVITDIFLQDTDRVAMLSLDFPEVVGIKHSRPYAIRLVSDRPLELILS